MYDRDKNSINHLIPYIQKLSLINYLFSTVFTYEEIYNEQMLLLSLSQLYSLLGYKINVTDVEIEVKLNNENINSLPDFFSTLKEDFKRYILSIDTEFLTFLYLCRNKQEHNNHYLNNFGKGQINDERTYNISVIIGESDRNYKYLKSIYDLKLITDNLLPNDEGFIFFYEIASHQIKKIIINIADIFIRFLNAFVKTDEVSKVIDYYIQHLSKIKNIL